jgi:hypothetical protein
MPTAIIEFYIKGALPNMEEPSDKKKERLALKLLRQGKPREAIKALGPLKFEWIWINGDGNPRRILAKIEDLEFRLTTRNSKVKIGEYRDGVSLTAAVKFELWPKKGVSAKKLQNWLNRNSMFFCGYVGGGWAYHQDEGGGLTVIDLK